MWYIGLHKVACWFVEVLWRWHLPCHGYRLELLVDLVSHQDHVVIESSHARQVGLELAGKLLFEEFRRIQDEHYPVEKLAYFRLELVVLEIAQFRLDRVHLLFFRLHSKLEFLRLCEITFWFCHLFQIEVLVVK